MDLESAKIGKKKFPCKVRCKTGCRDKAHVSRQNPYNVAKWREENRLFGLGTLTVGHTPGFCQDVSRGKGVQGWNPTWSRLSLRLEERTQDAGTRLGSRAGTGVHAGTLDLWLLQRRLHSCPAASLKQTGPERSHWLIARQISNLIGGETTVGAVLLAGCQCRHGRHAASRISRPAAWGRASCRAGSWFGPAGVEQLSYLLTMLQAGSRKREHS